MLDCYGEGPGISPKEDSNFGGVNDLSSISGSRNETFTKITFRRKTVTGDVKADNPLLVNEKMTIIWAWNSKTTGYHGDNRGIATINVRIKIHLFDNF